MIRLFVDAPLTAQANVPLSDKQAHYLNHVMRVGEGEELLVFNGRDGEWRARFMPKKKSADIVIAGQMRVQENEKSLHLFFAPIKRGHGDMAVEKASELGVTELTPIITARTITTRVPTERLAAIAIEAAEQCERLSVPVVHEPSRLQDVFANWPKNEKIFLCAEFGAATPIATALQKERPAGIIVGPEGGFTETEMKWLCAQDFITPVSLGPRVLRADTAAIAAISVIQAVAGDWTEVRK